MIVQGAIIGAQKSGTTSLYRYLAQHPQLATHSQREMSYFLNDHEFLLGAAAAGRKYFPDAGTRRRLAKHVMLMGSEAGLTRLSASSPEVRLILVLREPVARAYSAYWYARRRGWEDANSFEEALERESQRLATDGWERWRNCAYVTNGLYAEALERIERHFQSSQLLVIMDEDLRANARDCVRRCCKHLGIEDRSATLDYRIVHNTAAQPRSVWFARLLARLLSSRNAARRLLRRLIPHRAAYRLRHALLELNERPLAVPPIASETAMRLHEEFRSSNEALGARLGRLPPGW